MLDSLYKFLIAIALTGFAMLLATSSATAAPAGLSAAKSDTGAGITKVHGEDWHDDDDWEDDDYEYRRQHHRHHGRRHIDAPYAHVETGRHVVVDAPFAHVYVGRHGRRIVAPFVDIWVPRR